MLQRGHNNMIFSILGADGDRKLLHSEIKEKLIDYNNNILLETSFQRQAQISQLLPDIPQIISKEKNTALMQSISFQEVEMIVMGSPKSKAPSPNGFTFDFYQTCCPFMGKEIYELVEESRQT